MNVGRINLFWQTSRASGFPFSEQKILASDSTANDNLAEIPGRILHNGRWFILASRYDELQENYTHLLERLADQYILLNSTLSQVQQDKLIVMAFLREKHGLLRVSPRTLHTMRNKIKQECRDYLYLAFGNDPRAKKRIDEVFAKPKKSRATVDDSYTNQRIPLTPGKSGY